jgi:hypothetical protein
MDAFPRAEDIIDISSLADVQNYMQCAICIAGEELRQSVAAIKGPFRLIVALKASNQARGVIKMCEEEEKLTDIQVIARNSVNAQRKFLRLNGRVFDATLVPSPCKEKQQIKEDARQIYATLQREYLTEPVFEPDCQENDLD